MSNPPEDRVRAILSAILAAMGTEAPGLLAILDELRFLARGLLGRDSTGATQVGPSIWTILDEALWLNEPDGFGNTVRISLIQYLRLRLGDTAAATMVDGFAGTLGALGAIRSDLLYDEVLPNRTLGQQVESVRFNLQELGSTVANLENVLLGIQSISDRSSLLLSQVAPLAEGNDIYSALIAIADYSRRSAECCEDSVIGDFGPIPQDCLQGGALMAICYPASAIGTAVESWNIQLQPEGNLYLAPSVGGSQVLQYNNVGATSVWFYVQLANPDDLGGNDASFVWEPVVLSDPQEVPGRPNVEVNAFDTCTTGSTFYALGTGEGDPPIGYRPVLSLGTEGAVPTAGNVRILVFSSDF